MFVIWLSVFRREPSLRHTIATAIKQLWLFHSVYHCADMMTFWTSIYQSWYRSWTKSSYVFCLANVVRACTWLTECWREEKCLKGCHRVYKWDQMRFKRPWSQLKNSPRAFGNYIVFDKALVVMWQFREPGNLWIQKYLTSFPTKCNYHFVKCCIKLNYRFEPTE